METSVLLVCMLGLQSISVTSEEQTDITIGILMPCERWWAVILAVSDAKKNGYLDEKYQFRYEYENDEGGLVEGAGGTVKLRNRKIDLLLGSPSEMACLPAAILTSAWNMPHMTWGAGSVRLPNENKYSTLVTVGAPCKRLGEAVVRVLESCHLVSISIITRDCGLDMTFLPRCTGNVEGLLEALKVSRNVSVTTNIKYPSGVDLWDPYLKRVKTNTRVIFLCGLADEERSILLRAHALGMTKGDYVFVIPEPLQAKQKPWYRGDAYDAVAKQAYSAVFQVTPHFSHEEDREKLESLKRRIREEMASTHRSEEGEEEVTVASMLLYDTMSLYLRYLNTSPMNITDGSLLRTSVHKITFRGMTGPVVMDENGERIPDYLVYGPQKNGTYEPVVLFNAMGGTVKIQKERCLSLNDDFVPTDEDKAWPNQFLIGVTTGIATFLVLGVFTMTMVSFLRHRNVEIQLGRMTWMINPSDLVISEGDMPSSATSGLNESRHTGFSSMRHGGDMNPARVLTVGRCKGCAVVMERLHIGSQPLNRQYLMELNELRQLTHDNLNQFVGASVEQPIMWLLFAYYPKGSLQNVLLNQEIKLNWNFKHSLIDDLTQGLHFIHTKTSFKSHGRLKSTNCIIDSRWVLKITDHGIPELRQYRQRKAGDANKALLWTAPELLRLDPELRPLQGTQKSDVYSYALIVHEIIYRKGVFSWADVPASQLEDFFIEVLSKVREGLNPAHRPTLHKNVDETISQDSLSEVTMLLQCCWVETPDERPATTVIKMVLAGFTDEKKNVVDNRVERMEKYSEMLERVVDDRTGNLRAAKERTDRLLYRMLPKEVAEDLKAGVPVSPETYESVTVFNSDIVGFTVISSKSTPQQIVSLLTEINILFDDIIAAYNVYKVETIGDSYMVASGLPTRNEDRHIKEIADMSLHLVLALKDFVIPHRPDDPLKVRIGVHTGPCVAGVVGMKLPRYCLFGDTVIIATRMESHGEGLRIHLSEAANEAISKIGGYVTESRGEIEVKGMAKMTTYWLNSGPENPELQKTRHRHRQPPHLI